MPTGDDSSSSGNHFQISVSFFILETIGKILILVLSDRKSHISYQLSVISYQLSVISYQLSVISYQLSVQLTKKLIANIERRLG
ncbi:MAG: hypothetical protein EWV67_12805 [Microcystis sp. M_QC_C_20170808_M2Col]|nr:MAG: hypothetical protein EWV67_12805 [Microcystis sp. M_QC_C_20170808_M2Col]TRT70807.1 MAG: hypothetical protein EWV68_05960 [Microcystis sp. M_QC_C_20170808_M9Col]